MKKKFLILLILFLIPLFFFFNTETVKADELSDTVQDQLDRLNLDEASDLLNNIEKNDGTTLLDDFYRVLKGEYSVDYNSFFEYALNGLFLKVQLYASDFICIFAILVFAGLLTNSKEYLLNKEIGDTVSFILIVAIILILGNRLFNLIIESKNTIENLTKSAEIMSPIIVTLMVSTGESVSAGIYKPSVVFMSGSFSIIILNVVFPLVIIMTAFSVLSSFSEEIKLGKFAESIQSIIKTVLGFSVAIYGIFITVQGIAGASFDGVSAKIAKYALSSSIPLIGGLLKDGFDIVTLGSVLIKNSLGIACILSIIYTVIIPLISNVALSVLFKISAGISDVMSENSVSKIFSSLSKTITYINTCVLAVGFSFFITLLLMILSSGSTV